MDVHCGGVLVMCWCFALTLDLSQLTEEQDGAAGKPDDESGGEDKDDKDKGDGDAPGDGGPRA